MKIIFKYSFLPFYIFLASGLVYAAQEPIPSKNLSAWLGSWKTINGSYLNITDFDGELLIDGVMEIKSPVGDSKHLIGQGSCLHFFFSKDSKQLLGKRVGCDDSNNNGNVFLCKLEGRYVTCSMKDNTIVLRQE